MRNFSPNWAVEKRVFPADEEQRLIEALADRGIEYHEFEGHSFRYDSTLGSAAVARGSCYFVREMSYSPGWLAQLWGKPEQFSCTNYYRLFAEYLLNQEHQVMSFGELCWTQPQVVESFGNSDGQIFVRPDDGFKSFEGALVSVLEFEKWVARLQLLQVSNATKVVVARPVKIHAEWRLLVVKGRVVASSQYRPVRQAGSSGEVIAFAERVFREVDWPVDTCSLDIGLTESGFKIVEVGSLLCVAFYEADPGAVIDAVQPLVEAAKA